MKKIKVVTILLCCIMCIYSLTAQEKKNNIKKGYVINGKLTGLKDGSIIYITRNTRSKSKKVDTISFVKSRFDEFKFTGHLLPEDEGESYFIMLDKEDTAYKHLSKKYFLLHLENSNIYVSGAIDKLSPWDVNVQGSSVHEDLMDHHRKSRELFSNNPVYEERQNKTREVYNKLLEDTSIAAKSKLEVVDAELKAIRGERTAFSINWMKSHLNSLITPFLLSGKPDSLQDVMYPLLTKRVQNSFFGRKLKEEMIKKDKTALGKKAPELKLTDTEGETLSLHSVVLKNKLTIVDFWAFWCGPCRDSFSKMKKLYSEYHNKGLEVFGVSVDARKNDWLKAIKEDNLPWLNVIEKKEWNLSKELYGVHFVPAYLVLDHEGKILMKFTGLGLNEEKELKKLLAERLNGQ